MYAPPLDALAGRTAVLATMHHKERVIAPLLARFLGLQVQVPPGFDSDRFGTFSRDVARTGSALEAARAKIAAGFAQLPEARVGLASEGSFGPHPELPFVSMGLELVLLIDRDSGLELAGWHGAPAPYATGERISSLAGLRAFAARTAAHAGCAGSRAPASPWCAPGAAVARPAASPASSPARPCAGCPAPGA